MSPARIFVAQAKNGENVLPAFLERSSGFAFTGIEVVSNIVAADFVVAPHSIRALSEGNNRAYAERVIHFAREHGKRPILFLSGDLAYREHLEGAVVFKHSLFKHGRRACEIASVPFVDDPYAGKEFIPRPKSTRPSISFCGYAELKTTFDWAKYYSRNAACDVAEAFLGARWSAHKRGIYFRKKSMDILSCDARVETRFIVRDAFFGPIADEQNAVHRREYLENMKNADFALAPRGDGNYSRRFFRALSLGVVPILIDTDMVLPLEGVVDYSKFILRVPHTELHTLPDRVMDLWNSISDEEFQTMQRAARDAYVKYLNQAAFYNTVFPLLKERGV